ncbi:MAG: ABC transporter permease [Candidatus Heimdallarchaeota archaeon]
MSDEQSVAIGSTSTEGTRIRDELGDNEVSGATTWRIILKRFRRNQVAIVGLVILGFFVFLALLSLIDDITYTFLGEGILPYRPNDIFVQGASSFEPPSSDHIFGTDNVGRDIFVRIIFGARISMTVGFLAVFVSLAAGTVLGLVAGYYGGPIDSFISMILEILLAFPGILLALAMLSIFGSNLINAMIAVGIVYIPYYARVVRGQVLVERELIYVEAAKVLGAKTPRILLRHILPNILGVLIIYSTLGIGTAILEVAALSFLGLGALPPTAEWGSMIGEGRKHMISGPHLVLFPGLAILMVVLSFNLVGDGLREALDPRFKQ